MTQNNNDSLITPEEAGTLAGLFYERVQRTPDKPAYRYYHLPSETWRDLSWAEAGARVARWQAALAAEDLQPGDRVAIMMHNCPEWVMFDQAALANGLVVVPLYTQDRAENVAYILQNAGVKLLLIGHQEHWDSLQPVRDQLGFLNRIISVSHIDVAGHPDARLKTAGEWLPDEAELMRVNWDKDALATIVYTSGTTGKPKGVMLSHDNILYNAWGAAHCGVFTPADRFLSFLPLSHMLERMAGLYFPMMVGAEVVYSRGVNQLGDDLVTQKPTTLVSVPRIYERVYARIMSKLRKESAFRQKIFHKAVEVGWKRFEYQQGRGRFDKSILLWPLYKRLVADKILARLGGRLRYAICGGAALPPDIARMFIGLGLPMVQGYGMTETSPVICVNRPDDNIPESIGQALPGVEVRIGENDELQTRSRSVMLGYWNNEQATAETIDSDGWLHTGDQVRIENNHIHIVGRIKEIIVLSTGEKIPPGDMETIAANDPLFDQVLIHGEGRPYLVALIVLNRERWRKIAEKHDFAHHEPNHKAVERLLLKHLSRRLHGFPGYARIRRAWFTLEPWDIANGFMTPTLKLKRKAIAEANAKLLDSLYEGHNVE